MKNHALPTEKYHGYFTPKEIMRIDQLLNKLCLIKTRSIAKKACDKNLVKINDTIAKSSSKVHQNDVVEYQIYGYLTKIKILKIPKGNVSKANAAKFYEIMERNELEIY